MCLRLHYSIWFQLVVTVTTEERVFISGLNTFKFLKNNLNVFGYTLNYLFALVHYQLYDIYTCDIWGLPFYIKTPVTLSFTSFWENVLTYSFNLYKQMLSHLHILVKSQDNGDIWSENSSVLCLLAHFFYLLSLACQFDQTELINHPGRWFISPPVRRPMQESPSKAKVYIKLKRP